METQFEPVIEAGPRGPVVLSDEASALPRVQDGYAATWLGRLAWLLAVLFLCTFLILAIERARYPFELEWIEGGLLDEMRRVRAGQGLYVAPSVDYVPFIYNPLYFWTSSLVSLAFGENFFSMRLVSLLSALFSFLGIGALVRRESGSVVGGWLGAGLYAATFPLSVQFMDLARVDSLFVALVVATLWVLRSQPTLPGRCLAAGLLLACFLTKQSGLLTIAPLGLFLLWDGLQTATSLRGRLLAALPPLLVAAGVGLSVLLLQAASEGWYFYYAFELPREHRLVASLWVDFWTVDLMSPLGFACLGALFVLVGPSELPLRARLLWSAGLVGVLMTSWSSRLHDGGWTNVVMPTHALLAPLAALAAVTGFRLASGLSDAVQRARAQWFVQGAMVLQLAMLLYDPRACVPSARDLQAGLSIVDTLRAAHGDVFVPTNSYLSTLAGKQPHLHEMAVRDVFRGPRHPAADQLRRDIAQSLAQKRWSLVITDNNFYADHVLAHYARWKVAVQEPEVF
ncbi:MAG TPA: glycosyltransferase family 39 protein, partial [Polyangiales bacterium]